LAFRSKNQIFLDDLSLTLCFDVKRRQKQIKIRQVGLHRQHSQSFSCGATTMQARGLMLLALGCQAKAVTYFDDWAISPTTGTTILDIIPTTLTIKGVTYPRYAITGTGSQYKTVSGVGCIWLTPEDTEYRFLYRNQMDVETTIHQHGQTPPHNLDGVPYLSQVPILPHRSTVYNFQIHPENRGTYFVHSHYGFQHGAGLAAPLIVQGPFPTGYPLGANYSKAVEAVMFLEDFCAYNVDDPTTNPNCNDPLQVLEGLTGGWNGEKVGWQFGGGYLPNGKSDPELQCMAAGLGGDVGYRHQLCNKRTFDNPAVQVVEPGALVRLRVIDAAGMSNYKVVFPSSLSQAVTVIAVDGQFTQPMKLETFPGNGVNQENGFWVGVAQRFDVIIQMPTTPGMYPIIARSDSPASPHRQSGFVLQVGGTAPNVYSGSGIQPDPNGPGFMGTPVTAIQGRASNGIAQEAMLSAWYPLKPNPTPDFEFKLNLTGDNGFNSMNTHFYQLVPLANNATLPFEPNKNPLVVESGKRACVEIWNHNADSHAMHLHGHSFQVVSVLNQPVNGAFRDTILMPKGGCRQVKVCFNTDNPGVWPFHCHMSYHLGAGMLTTLEYGDNVVVEDLPGSPIARVPVPPAPKVETVYERDPTNSALLFVSAFALLALVGAVSAAYIYRGQAIAASKHSPDVEMSSYMPMEQ
jgi:FtsP/CotA-like multicopper oxidase with cupredoxin domain